MISMRVATHLDKNLAKILTTTGVGAEIFSAFTNPYYLTHKVVQLPTMYQNVVDVYKKYSTPQN